MRSGGGVLCIAGLQIIVGLCLLGIYEGFKARRFRSAARSPAACCAAAGSSTDARARFSAEGGSSSIADVGLASRPVTRRICCECGGVTAAFPGESAPWRL